MKQRLLLTILSLFLLNVSILADYYTDDQRVKYSYDSSGSTASVYDGKSASGEVVIPKTIEVYGKTYTVTSIDIGAFRGCTGLTSVTIPNSVRSIGRYAFSYCTRLTSVTIPNSVTSIGNFAFEDCTGLTSIVVAEDNPTFDSRNNCNCIIETSSNTLAVGCKNSVIPNSVTSIGYGAFDGTGLTARTIPSSVTSIGESAFSRCI